MLSRFSVIREKRGVAAVEFALIAPVIVLLFFGLIELCQGMNAKQRVEYVASTTSDLVAQSTNMTPTAVNNVFGAAGAILFPYPAGSNVTIVISSLVENGTTPNSAKVVWSKTKNGTARPVDSTLTIPAGVITPGGSVIYAEVSYSFTSLTHYVIGNSVTMTSKFFSRPRRTVQVTWSNS
jgi:Flp pilus assembly protein TadG